MGMFDNVVILDEILSCPHGHPVSGFQTKSFDDPSADVYLFNGPQVYRVVPARFADSAGIAAEHWRLEAAEAVFQRRHAIEPVVTPPEVVFYTSCSECAPVLVRRDRAYAWGDLVDERQLWVEFRATFGAVDTRNIERTSGTRDELAAELRGEGLRVLRDDEPLAIAHHEIRTAQGAVSTRRSQRRR